MHALCVESAAAKEATALATAWESDRIRRDAVMKRLLLTALHVDKNKISHRGYERELVLIHLVGGDVVDSEHSRKTCREMLQVNKHATTCRLRTLSRASESGMLAHRLTSRPTTAESSRR